MVQYAKVTEKMPWYNAFMQYVSDSIAGSQKKNKVQLQPETKLERQKEEIKHKHNGKQ